MKIQFELLEGYPTTAPLIKSKSTIVNDRLPNSQHNYVRELKSKLQIHIQKIVGILHPSNLISILKANKKVGNRMLFDIILESIDFFSNYDPLKQSSSPEELKTLPTPATPITKTEPTKSTPTTITKTTTNNKESTQFVRYAKPKIGKKKN